jgi:hypothetical protein
MQTFILRIMDWDRTWVGLGWLRPKPSARLPFRSVLWITLCTSLMFIPVGLLMYWWFRQFFPFEEAFALTLLVIVGSIASNFALQWLSAVIWNRRAEKLQQQI